MSVADLEKEDIPVLFFGSHLAVYTVKRDDDLIGGIVEIAHKWWRDHVQSGVAPDVDGLERTKETLQKMFNRSTGALRVDNVEGAVLALQYEQARKEEKAAADRKEIAANQLRMLIASHDGIEGEWGKATWRADASGRPSWKDIAAEFAPIPAELIEKHTSAPGRTLRVNIKGEKRR